MQVCELKFMAASIGKTSVSCAERIVALRRVLGLEIRVSKTDRILESLGVLTARDTLRLYRSRWL